MPSPLSGTGCSIQQGVAVGTLTPAHFRAGAFHGSAHFRQLRPHQELKRHRNLHFLTTPSPERTKHMAQRAVRPTFFWMHALYFLVLRPPKRLQLPLPHLATTWGNVPLAWPLPNFLILAASLAVQAPLAAALRDVFPLPRGGGGALRDSLPLPDSFLRPDSIPLPRSSGATAVGGEAPAKSRTEARIESRRARLAAMTAAQARA
mmetsp:Transcript_124624/g.363927  ORF Transcript_124624/g.363927 Transcript_124624/m.363927 type:complete len:205 (+) Transcript_124624:192-806(+)